MRKLYKFTTIKVKICKTTYPYPPIKILVKKNSQVRVLVSRSICLSFILFGFVPRDQGLCTTTCINMFILYIKR